MAGLCFQCSSALAVVFCTASNRPYCQACAMQVWNNLIVCYVNTVRCVNHLQSCTWMRCQPLWIAARWSDVSSIIHWLQSCGTGMPLDRFCRLCGVAVCMDCKLSGRHQGKEHVFLSVEESYQVTFNLLSLAESHVSQWYLRLLNSVPPLSLWLHDSKSMNTALRTLCWIQCVKWTTSNKILSLMCHTTCRSLCSMSCDLFFEFRLGKQSNYVNLMLTALSLTLIVFWSSITTSNRCVQRLYACAQYSHFWWW